MEIIARTNPSQSPYRISENGKDIFFCNYLHEAEAFIRGVKYATSKQAERDLWTNHEERFEVKEQNGFFYVYDHARYTIVDNGLFQNELEAYDLKEDTIKEAEFQNQYENKSGR